MSSDIHKHSIWLFSAFSLCSYEHSNSNFTIRALSTSIIILNLQLIQQTGLHFSSSPRLGSVLLVTESVRIIHIVIRRTDNLPTTSPAIVFPIVVSVIIIETVVERVIIKRTISGRRHIIPLIQQTILRLIPWRLCPVRIMRSIFW